jgi:biopolymer transport protein ExbD
MLPVRVRARKHYRQLRRGLPEEESVSHLNITPMMDMMTILLVFFLKNFSLSADNINLSGDLMLPSSTSSLKVHQAISITLTKKAIIVEDDAIATVKKGAVDASLKRDGSSSFVISPLLDMLQKHATRLKKIEEMTKGTKNPMKFEGEIIIVADQNTPYRLISEVLYTAGQAEYGKYRLMVLKK